VNSEEKNRWLGRGVSVTTVSSESRRIHFPQKRGLYPGVATIAQLYKGADHEPITISCADCSRTRFTGAVLHLAGPRTIGRLLRHDAQKREQPSAIWRSHRTHPRCKRSTTIPRDASDQSLQSGLDAMTTCWISQVTSFI